MSRVKLAETADDIQGCFEVMVQLRPHVSADAFVERIQNQMKDGYRIAFISVGGQCVSAAGFRIGHNLAWGKFMYVDDLISNDESRSKGHGKKLLEWLEDYARQDGCDELHLDSGVQRFDAHRFYQREGMHIACHHFAKGL